MLDTSPTLISALLDYLYTGEAPNMDTLAKDLMNIANKPRLFAICQENLTKQLQVSNAIEILCLAMLHSAEDLKKWCLRFIGSNFAAVRSSPGWTCLTVTEENTLLLEIASIVTY